MTYAAHAMLLSGTRLFSHPGWRACLGNLEALWEDPSRDAFMRIGAIEWTPGEDIFLLFAMTVFAGMLSVMHCRRPL